jgi:hypothetical protein
VQFLHVDGRRRFGLAVAAEDLGRPFQKLRAPGRDLIGVDVELLGQFSQRLLALDRGKRDFRLEGRTVVPARSSAHGLSCSRHHADLRQKFHLSRESSFPEPALSAQMPTANAIKRKS